MSRLVEFRGERYWLLIDNKEGKQSGALAYLHHCDEKGNVKPECALETSFAHLYDDGNINRFGQVIGHSIDLKEVKVSKSEIILGNDANTYGQRVVKETMLMFEVRYDAKRRQVVFLGTDVLTAALEQGMEVERYVSDKLAQARERLVKKQ